MFKRSWLTGLAITVLVAQACGSDDGKKKVLSGAEGGAGGEAGGPDMGQDAAGAAGKPPVNEGGTGGAGEVVTGGTGGAEEPPIPMAGAGGEAPLPPNPELLFSVKYGAHGLTDTAISTQGSPENFIYTTSTASQDAVDGTNAVKVTGAALGLAETDAIVAFAEEQVEPKNPMYLFTLADGSEGTSGTRSYEAAKHSGAEEGNLYFSGGEVLFDYGNGESNYYEGYNGLSASQVSLGLTTGENLDANPDDLRGLAVHDANKQLKELYFSVYTDAVGATDSAVDSVDSDHQGCTVFKSALDGTNSVAFTCEQLGLTIADQIDALAIFKGAEGPTVIFSVTNASQGAPGSTVASVLASTSTIGATLFKSVGDGTNTVHLPGKELGLDEYDYPFDELDGVAIIDQPKVTAGANQSCQLSYDPYDATEGGLGSIESTGSVGNNVMVLFGPVAQAGAGARLLAYDATTCEFLQQVDLPQEFENGHALAIVPVTGWAASKPLDKVEYYRAQTANLDLELRRYDAAGVLQSQYPLASTTYAGAMGLFYASGEFTLVLDGNNGQVNYRRMSFPAPNVDTVNIDAPIHRLTRPCFDQADVGGVDSDGNLYLARSQEVNSDFRVCGYRSDAEMLPLPYAWTSDAEGYVGGFIVPGASHFLLHSDEPMWIERSAFPKL